MILLKEIVVDSLGTFWALRLFLFAVLVFCGWGITYKNSGNRYFWYYAVPVILFYSLIEGLRFDRGIDYYHYYQEIIGAYGDLGTFAREPLYQFIIDAGMWLGTPFWVTFIFYSALLITCVMLVIKQLPRLAFWALPIFFVLTVASSENIIRQYIAISFLFLAYSFYLQDKKLWMYVSLLCVPMVHLSGLFPVVIFIFAVYVDLPKYLRWPWVPLLLFFFLAAFWEIANFSAYTEAIGNIGGLQDTSYQQYLDNSQRWFSEDGSISNVVGSTGVDSILTVASRFVTNVAIIWFGFRLAKEDKRFRIPYIFSYVSILIFQISGDIELFMRFGWWLRPFEPLMAAGILMYGKFSRPVRICLITLFFVTYIAKFFSGVGQHNQFGEAFIWDIVR